ncbi:MAG: GerAB/ArcD/ProY family transporter [Nanoarchaeota archaeon]|nr:GerAB/ArcD/ProY family transporter [Nanoarchaeota archaeon]
MGKHLLGAVATLIGLIIGAGVIGIPYVVAKSGFLIGAIHIIVIGIAITIINLYVGEIALRTPGKHQFTTYAEKYLGKWGKKAMLLALMVSIYGALAAYLIGEGISLSQVFGISPNIAMLLFFVVMAFFIFRGLNIIEGAEIYLNIFRFIVIGVVIVFAFLKIDFSNLTTINTSYFLFPYGVVFFAFLGAVAIPELKEELKANKKLLKKAILIGSIIPIVFYLLFAAVVVGVLGSGATEIATTGLADALGRPMMVLGDLFAIVSMATAFLVAGLALKWVYQFDYRMNRHIAFALTCFVPLLIAFAGVAGFTKILAVTGAVAGGVEGTLIVFMHRKARLQGKPEYSIKSRWWVNALLVIMFVGGIAYTFATL